MPNTCETEGCDNELTDAEAEYDGRCGECWDLQYRRARRNLTW